MAIIVAVFCYEKISMFYYNDEEYTEEKNVVTQYGDNFVISIPKYRWDPSIINVEYNFICCIPQYHEGDMLLELCDTPNVTCYRISNITICKLKELNEMVALNSNVQNKAEIYDALVQIASNDDIAKQYININ